MNGIEICGCETLVGPQLSLVVQQGRAVSGNAHGISTRTVYTQVPCTYSH